MPIKKHNTNKTKSSLATFSKSLLLLFALVFGYGIVNAGNNSARVIPTYIGTREWRVKVTTSHRLAEVVRESMVSGINVQKKRKVVFFNYTTSPKTNHNTTSFSLRRRHTIFAQHYSSQDEVKKGRYSTPVHSGPGSCKYRKQSVG